MQVFGQVVELAIDHGVSVKEVEKVHQPENGLLLSARSGGILTHKLTIMYRSIFLTRAISRGSVLAAEPNLSY